MSDKSDRSDSFKLSSADSETAANTMICLVNQASYLLHRQMQSLEQKFLEEGGSIERLYDKRQSRRDKP